MRAAIRGSLLRAVAAVAVYGAILCALLATDDYTYGPLSGQFTGWRQGSNPVLKRLGSDSTWRVPNDMGEPLFAVLVGIILWRMDPSRKRLVACYAAGVIAASLISGVSAALIGRMRPEIADGLTKVLPWGERFTEYRHTSLPSGHATVAAAIATYVALAYPPLRVLAIVCAISCALARIKFRKPFASDVLAGLLVGHYVMLWMWARFNRPAPKDAPASQAPVSAPPR